MPLDCRNSDNPGVFAARRLIEGSDFDVPGQQDIGAMACLGGQSRRVRPVEQPQLSLGFASYGSRRSRAQTRALLQRHNQPSPPKRLLVPLAHWRLWSLRQDASCHQPDCDRVWCRHGAGHQIE